MTAVLNGNAVGGGGASLPVSDPAALLAGATASRLIATDASGDGTVLAAGTSGYILRSVSGAPVWRELSSSGLAASRPAAAAAREGQSYWSTDAAAGLELSECVHKGGSTYAWEVIPYGATTTGTALVQSTDAAAGRTALGLGGAAVLNVGTTAGTVAAGNILSTSGLSTTPAVGQTAADGNLYAVAPNASGTTTTAGVGTASASATTVTLSVGGATLSTWYAGTYNAPRATTSMSVSTSAPALSPHRFQATARIASRSGTGGAVFTNTVAILGLDGGASYRYGIYAKDTTVGTENESSTGATGLVSTTSAGLAWDGNDWLRIRVDGAQIMFYFARGSGGAAPAETAWAAIGTTTYTVPANFAGFSIVLLLVQSSAGTGGSGPTLTYDNITIRRLP